jgi:hypothetical protein
MSTPEVGTVLTVDGKPYIAAPREGFGDQSACLGCAGRWQRLCAKLPDCYNIVFKPYTRNQPTGTKPTDPHAPGAKLDTGKVRPSLILNGMARALYAVSEVGTFGAIKYTDGGWVHVPNGFARYEDAQQRHALARAKGETHDPESKLLHLQHEAWNALAKLDLYLREQEKAA